MKTLITIFTGLCLITNSVAGQPMQGPRIPFYILNAAHKHGIDAVLMYAICLTESRCKARAVNKNDGTKSDKEAGIVKKSYGLFQIQVDTAKSVGFEDKEEITITKKRGKKVVTITKFVDKTWDLLKPQVNSDIAGKLLKRLYSKYKNTNQVISAYNAGHYTKCNKDYVLKVLENYAHLKIDNRF